jgi:hypothetical protein
MSKKTPWNTNKKILLRSFSCLQNKRWPYCSNRDTHKYVWHTLSYLNSMLTYCYIWLHSLLPKKKCSIDLIDATSWMQGRYKNFSSKSTIHLRNVSARLENRTSCNQVLHGFTDTWSRSWIRSPIVRMELTLKKTITWCRSHADCIIWAGSKKKKKPENQTKPVWC